MLNENAVDRELLDLVGKLQQKSYLTDFYLVGGTALALYYGHRKSEDIDLFSNVGFDARQLLEEINQDFNYQLFNTAENTLKGSIDGINVDIIAHRYPYLKNPIVRDDISLLSDCDIIAMKLNAISVSGQRSKDFIDLYYALQNHSLNDIISFYKDKYNQKSESHILKSMVYFEDVDLADWPILLAEPELSWETVKKEIVEKVRIYTLK